MINEKIRKRMKLPKLEYGKRYSERTLRMFPCVPGTMVKEGQKFFVHPDDNWFNQSREDLNGCIAKWSGSPAYSSRTAMAYLHIILLDDD